MNIKFFNSIAVAALSVLTIACTKEQVDVDSQLQSVSFTVEAPGAPATKAIGDGTSAKKLYYQVYDQDGKVIEGLPCQQTDLVDKKATVNFRLMKEKTYQIIFWAQTTLKSGKAYYKVDEKEGPKKISANYEEAKSNLNSYDAFYAVKTVSVSGAVSETVTLKRPLALVNIATSDMLKAGDAETLLAIKGAKSLVTFKQIPTVFSPLATPDKQFSGYADVTFDYFTIPSGNITIGDKEYKYLAANFIFAPEEGTVYDLEATIKNDGNDILLKAPSTPVKRNWKTNIYGSLLTTTADYNVVIDPAFETEETNIEIVVANDKASFIQAYEAGKSTIELDADIILDEAMVLDRDITIIGNGHKILNSSEDAIQITKGATINLHDIDLTSESNKRCINFTNASTGAKVLLDGCTLSADLYAINLNQGSEKIEISVNNSTLEGWAALNSFSNKSKFYFDGCTIKGNKGTVSYDFATIVIDGGNINSGVAPDTYGFENIVEIKNSDVIAYKHWLSLQYGANNNEVKYYSKTTTITDGNGKDMSSEYIISNGDIVGVVTNNTVTKCL